MSKLSPELAASLYARQRDRFSTERIKAQASSATQIAARAAQLDYKSRDAKLAAAVGAELFKKLGVLWLDIPEDVRGKSAPANLKDPAEIQAHIQKLAEETVADMRTELSQNPEYQPLLWQTAKLDYVAAEEATAAAFAEDSEVMQFAEGAERRRKTKNYLLIGGGVALVGGIAYFALRSPDEV
jgi:hypothetical protein